MRTFIPVSLDFLAIDRNSLQQIARLEAFRFDRASMPDEILEKFIGVLFLHDLASSADDISEVLNELFALRGEFINFDRRVFANISKSLVYLSVRGEFSFPEGVNDTVEANLCQFELE